MRLEYRHDHADRELYLNDTPDPSQPDRAYQDTLTLGLAAGF